jgi:hypothetical protein
MLATLFPNPDSTEMEYIASRKPHRDGFVGATEPPARDKKDRLRGVGEILDMPERRKGHSTTSTGETVEEAGDERASKKYRLATAWTTPEGF